MKRQEAAIVPEAGREAAILEVRLESGVILSVRRDGSASGSDGKTYFPILREFRETFLGRPDVVARVVGWSSDLDGEKVLPLEE